MTLAQSAADLEAALQQTGGDVTWAPLSATVNDKLRTVLAGITQLGSAPDSGAALVATTISGPRFQQCLDELKRLLADSDAASLDSLSELEGIVAGSGEAIQLREVAAKIETFDFDEALALLNTVSFVR
jgi:hypothetical protein